jgi:Rhodopirellula transposase DDE domain
VKSDVVDQLRSKFVALAPALNERARRLWAATEAMVLGRGGVTRVMAATGLARRTVNEGMLELTRQGRQAEGTPPQVKEPIRRPGGGRKKLTQKDPQLLSALEALVAPATRGDPESPLKWCSKSTEHLADELTKQGHPVSPRTVATLLSEQLEYNLQGNRKTREGSSHPDRNAQFEHINEQTQAFQRRAQPVISVDTKKKELVGNYKNGGREWNPQGEPEEVNGHDFPDPNQGKGIPYGVYDIMANRGWVSVGIDHDTGAFAVQSIRTWWEKMGQAASPQATELLVMADCGGSNGYRCRLWKVELQKFADESGLSVSVCHFPPGTSKWNKIEHRMFSFISMNWRGRPLLSYEVIVNLIGHTTTKTGLVIRAELDRREYPKGVKVTKEDMKRLQIERAEFHGEWNYTIKPRKEPA